MEPTKAPFHVLIAGFGDDLCCQQEEIRMFEGLASVTVSQSPSREELLALVAEADAIQTDFCKIDAEVFAAAKRLKIVSEYGVGIDNIDLAAAKSHGVVVCNVPGVYTRAVAEHTAALILASTREICAANASVHETHAWNSALFHPQKLERKVLGLIGCGQIGKTLLHVLSGFDLEYCVYDPYLSPGAAKACGAALVTMDELCARADVISIHIPHTEQTHHIIDGAFLAAVKPGVVLVNVSRGGVIDEAALCSALASGIVGAAALDVVEGEPDVESNALLQQKNVILTPHMGWKSEDAAYRVETACANNVIRFLRDGDSINVSR